jgi:ABC-type nitrate/sulfonate/bicarbonate transport system substrate-binding protein
MPMRVGIAGWLVAMATALLATVAGLASAQAPVPVRVISFGGGFNLPLWAGQSQGFFATNGIDVKLSHTPDSKALFADLAAGRQDIAMTAFDNVVAYQEGQGEVALGETDFFAFMGSDSGFLSLVAAPDVKRVGDLRGKEVSVDAMSNGFAFALREMLTKNGVAETDVTWARAGGTDRRYQALVEGKHAATMLRAPFDLLAMNKGYNRLATAPEVLGPYMGIAGVARRSWARENERLVIGYIRGYSAAVAWLYDRNNREAVEAILMANVKTMTPELARQSYELMLDEKTGFFRDVALDPAGVSTVLALRSKYGEPKKTLFDPSRYPDHRYLEAASGKRP